MEQKSKLLHHYQDIDNTITETLQKFAETTSLLESEIADLKQETAAQHKIDFTAVDQAVREGEDEIAQLERDKASKQRAVRQLDEEIG